MRSTAALFASAALVATASQTAASSTCFVAPAGVASGSCAQGSPCDLAYAIQQIAQCDNGTILLEPGTYAENVDITQPGFVNLVGLAGGVVLQGGDGACGVQVDATGSTQILLYNLEILGASLGSTPGAYSGICVNFAATLVSISLDRVVVTGAPGAGIEIVPGGTQLSIVDSAIVSNGTDPLTSIGGIFLHHGANLSISRSLIAGNTNNYFPQGGGGLASNPNTGGYPATITNSTFANNHAKTAAAIFPNNIVMTLSNVTLAPDNTAVDGSILYAGSNVEVDHSIIGGACQGTALGSGSEGSIESPGNTCGLSSNVNQVDVSLGNLNLDALANNGGPTQTMLPKAGSVAIGNGSAGVPCEAVDQRNFVRIGACDVGAAQTNATTSDEIFRGAFELW